jgi:hypothetical protein
LYKKKSRRNHPPGIFVNNRTIICPLHRKLHHKLPVSLPACPLHRKLRHMLPASLPACRKNHMLPACQLHHMLLTESQLPSLSNQISLKVP